MIAVTCTACNWEGARDESTPQNDLQCPRCLKYDTLRAHPYPHLVRPETPDERQHRESVTATQEVVALLVLELGARKLYPAGASPFVDIYLLPDLKLVLVQTLPVGGCVVYVPLNDGAVTTDDVKAQVRKYAARQDVVLPAAHSLISGEEQAQ